MISFVRRRSVRIRKPSFSPSNYENRSIFDWPLQSTAITKGPVLFSTFGGVILEDAAVRQVCLALRLMTGAKSAVRDWDNRVEELRLLPRI